MQIFLADIRSCYDKEGWKSSAEHTRARAHTQVQFNWSRNPGSMLSLSSGYYQSYAAARISFSETEQDFESLHLRSEQKVHLKNLPYKCF